MDGKRKASSSRRAGPSDVPPAKRRKPLTDFPDLMKGETPESTSAHGLHFLDHIRRTSDKSGRVVSKYFERLLPKKGNEDYYSKVLMPISFRVIERRLYRQDFENLRELESWLKRMVTNAKEYYNKNSPTFDDAEKVRKATSNWFVKYNPAYKKIESYAATPIAIPADYNVDAELELEDMDPETAVAEMGARLPRSPPVHQPPTEVAEEDAGDEDDEMADADADAEGDEDAEADEDTVEDARAPGKRIVLRRGAATSHDAPARETDTPSSTGNAGGAQYSGVPYQGLNFQKAQEKILDSLIKRVDEEDDEWPYFEPFINLPDKTLKDYYQLIDNPMSLKKMSRVVKGMQGRGGATGLTLYKSWAAMEQDAKLLWTNAQYYNEEGSDIYELAGELRDAFYEQFNEAKAAVQEPTQPKIKLRAPSAAQPQPSAPAKHKRITIHVGGGREGSQESPAPLSGPTHSSSTPQPAFNGSTARPGPVTAQITSLSQGAAASPPPAVAAPALKHEEPVRQTPVIPPQVSNGYSSSAFRPAMSPANGYGQPHLGMVNGHAPPAPAVAPAVPVARKSPVDVKYRAGGPSVKDAVLTNLCIRTPLDNNPEQRFVFNAPADPELLQQHFTINLSSTQWKPQILASVSPALAQQRRAYKLFVLVNGQVLHETVSSHREPLKLGEVLFETSLHQGVNTISVHLVAALPEGQKMPNGADAVMEKIMVLANVAKH